MLNAEFYELLIRMEGAMELAVPLVVDMSMGKNWLEAH